MSNTSDALGPVRELFAMGFGQNAYAACDGGNRPISPVGGGNANTPVDQWQVGPNGRCF